MAEQLIQATSEELRDVFSKEVISNDPTAHGTALGIHLDTQTDELYVVTPEIQPGIPTKRTVASTATKTCDIMGWFGPVTLTVKLLMQALWQTGTCWDNPIPEQYIVPWRTWSTHLLMPPLEVMEP